MTASPLIVCDNLVRIYKIANLEVVALQGLDLVISDGELVGVVGASGSGKSTLLNILGGLDRPSAGRVWVGGEDLLKMSENDLKRYRLARVGFVWQQGKRNLVPYLSARENIELPMIMAGVSGEERRSYSMELLEAVGLREREKHRLSELSGGEQQRVAIAVALANHPRLLLADEPTGELDTATAEIIYQLIQDLNRQMKITALIVSHDPGIARHVDRVVSIRDGKLSSETFRSTGTPAPKGGQPGATGEVAIDESRPAVDAPVQTQAVYEELTVVDSAGRLQIPKAYLEKHQIRGRVRLELTEDGIKILPANHREHGPTAEWLAEELTETRSGNGLRGWLQRVQTSRSAKKKIDESK